VTTLESETTRVTGQSVGADTHWSITKFLIEEAELLDRWRYRDWAQRITDDFSYQVPIPVTRGDPQRGSYADDGFIVDETRASLELWFRRHEPPLFEYAWGENHCNAPAASSPTSRPGTSQDQMRSRSAPTCC
jgi:hypothetical protein